MTVSFLADEHVPRVLTSTLRSNGYMVVTAQERYGHESVNETILQDCGDAGLAVLTNDRDFIALDETTDHAGIVLYTAQNPSPATFVGALDRVLQFHTSDELANQVVWLDEWYGLSK